jgi:hypothetical protein
MKDLDGSFELELGHKYRMDANKSIGVGDLSSGYKPYVIHTWNDGRSPIAEIGEEYKSLISKFNEANAFARRRLEKPLVEFMDNLPKGNPFSYLVGKSYLVEVDYKASLAFDFEEMSKTLVMSSQFCEGSNRLYVLHDNIRVYPQKFTDGRGKQCLLTVKFDDDVLAEHFEVMVSEGTLVLFLKVSFVPYAEYGVRFAIGDTLVFTEKKLNNVYKVKGYQQVLQVETVSTIQEYEYEYVMSIEPKEVIHDASNLLASVNPARDAGYANDDEYLALNAARDLKTLQLTAPLDSALRGNGKTISDDHYLTLTEDGLMTITVGNEERGAYGEYQWVKQNDRYYAYATKQHINQVILSNVYLLSSATTIEKPRGNIVNFSISLKPLSLDARGFNFAYNPIKMDSLLALQKDMGVNEATLKAMDIKVPYESKADFSKKDTPKPKQASNNNVVEPVAQASKPTPSHASPPYNLVCDLEVLEHEEAGMFMKYTKKFKGRQLLPLVDVTEFLDNVVAYSKREMGDIYRKGGRLTNGVEIKQFVGKKQGTISTVYSVKDNYLHIDAIFPDSVVPAGDAVKKALCTAIEEF